VASRPAFLLFALILAAFPASTFAVSPILWTLETFDDFEKGKPDGAAVAAGGELVLAPALRPLKIPAIEQASEPFLWSQAVDSKQQGHPVRRRRQRRQDLPRPEGSPRILVLRDR